MKMNLKIAVICAVIAIPVVWLVIFTHTPLHLSELMDTGDVSRIEIRLYGNPEEVVEITDDTVIVDTIKRLDDITLTRFFFNWDRGDGCCAYELCFYHESAKEDDSESCSRFEMYYDSFDYDGTRYADDGRYQALARELFNRYDKKPRLETNYDRIDLTVGDKTVSVGYDDSDGSYDQERILGALERQELRLTGGKEKPEKAEIRLSLYGADENGNDKQTEILIDKYVWIDDKAYSAKSISELETMLRNILKTVSL